MMNRILPPKKASKERLFSFFGEVSVRLSELADRIERNNDIIDRNRTESINTCAELKNLIDELHERVDGLTEIEKFEAITSNHGMRLHDMEEYKQINSTAWQTAKFVLSGTVALVISLSGIIYTFIDHDISQWQKDLKTVKMISDANKSQLESIRRNQESSGVDL